MGGGGFAARSGDGERDGDAQGLRSVRAAFTDIDHTRIGAHVHRGRVDGH